MELTYRPLEKWPGGFTKVRRRSQFKATFQRSLNDLENELRHLGASYCIIQVAVAQGDIRIDGRLRGGASPVHPGVIVSFESRHGPLSYPCDQYTDWRDNLRAIILALEALRAVDRYGVTRKAEQYKGWTALPSPDNGQMSLEEAAVLVGHYAGRLPETLVHDRRAMDEAVKVAESKSHPDGGGSATAFTKVQKAREALHRHHFGANA